MKKSVLFIICTAVLLLSCHKEVDYNKMLEGVWSCTEVNNLTIPTDNMLVLDFAPAGKAVSSSGYQQDNAHAQFVKADWNYQVDDNRLTMTAVLSADETMLLRFEITSISENKMIAHLQEVSPAHALNLKMGKYTFNKVVFPDKYKEQIRGDWNGYRHQAGKYDSLATIKMNFAGENDFVFSKLNNEQWNSCSGSFTLFGDKMVVSYATEVSSYFDAWEIHSINAQEMVLQKYNAQSDSSAILNVVRYKMVRQ